MKVHSFNVEEAELHGVDKAVILYNIRFWLEKNKANDRDSHKHDGYYWTYNSAKAFAKLFPYYRQHKIHRLLKQMEDDGLILASNYNKAAYDRTKWYSMPEFSIEDVDNKHFTELQNGNLENEESHFTELQNGNCISGEPIPDINTDSKPNVNTDIGDKKKSPKKSSKKLTDYPDDFKLTDKQIDRMNEYGINIPLFLETFESSTKAKGIQYKCWTSACTTWINNEIKFNKLVPMASLPAQQEYEPAFNGWNDRNPDYQQPDAYHPSHDAGKPMVDTRPSPPVADNWTWKEPLPGKSIPETDKLIKAKRRKGEPTKKTYDRLLAEIQEQVQ